jgi:hypothetical protein
VENIPFQAERHSARRQKLFALPPEWRSLSQRNTVRIHNGMVFGFRPESRSSSTGFPMQAGTPLPPIFPGNNLNIKGLNGLQPHIRQSMSDVGYLPTCGYEMTLTLTPGSLYSG